MSGLFLFIEVGGGRRLKTVAEMSEVHGASLTPRPIHDLSAMQGGDQRTGHIALVRMALTDQLG